MLSPLDFALNLPLGYEQDYDGAERMIRERDTETRRLVTDDIVQLLRATGHPDAAAVVADAVRERGGGGG